MIDDNTGIFAATAKSHKQVMRDLQALSCFSHGRGGVLGTIGGLGIGRLHPPCPTFTRTHVLMTWALSIHIFMWGFPWAEINIHTAASSSTSSAQFNFLLNCWGGKQVSRHISSGAEVLLVWWAVKLSTTPVQQEQAFLFNNLKYILHDIICLCDVFNINMDMMLEAYHHITDVIWAKVCVVHLLQCWSCRAVFVVLLYHDEGVASVPTVWLESFPLT